MQKSIKELAWNVTEPEYRANPAISYSTLSTFAKGGPSVIPTIHAKKEAPALRFGGLLDTLITEPEVVNERYFIGEFPSLSETLLKIVKHIYSLVSSEYRTLEDVPPNIILDIAREYQHGKGWHDETVIKDVIKKASEYYQLLSIASNKTIMSNDDYLRASNCATVLQTHPYTKPFFGDELAANNYFADTDLIEIEKHYQLKFLLEEEGIRCMFDEVWVNHTNKTIRPIDLKSTAGDEDDFNRAFKMWRYDIQATMYWYILRRIMDKDEYFKDFTLLPFTFVYISKFNQTPIIYEYDDAHVAGDRIDRYGTEFKSWQTLLREFKWHRENQLFDYSMEVYANSGWMKVTSLEVKKDETGSN